MSATLVEIDGSEGEGGGQVLRTSLALSLLTGRPFHLRNVRAGRKKPGLQPQHLMSVQAAARIGQAHVRGDILSSKDLVFEPGEVSAGSHRFDIGTAGATSLVLHTLYLPLALRGKEPSHLTLVGGTHVLASPCFHFLETTWRAHLERMGLRVDLKLVRPGFYPRGGGIVEAIIHPCSELTALHIGNRDKVAIRGFSAVAGLPEDIAHRMARRATQRLKAKRLSSEMTVESWAGGPGAGLGLVLETEPVPVLFFGQGERGKPADKVADEAVEQVLRYLERGEAAVDCHSADQIVLPLALAAGSSTFHVSEVTQHLLTNIAVIHQFIDRNLTCDGKEGEPGMVRID
ncbi:MAG TPA: RNA 3'-terminal phosphate cyclase [Gemmataceae bacterium]|nr:RNA 3'-terminal phosphate cyclase [Gemmataceae bacterium]